MTSVVKAIQAKKEKEFNTNDIPTYEVPVPPRVKDPRQLLNTATMVAGAAYTVAAASQGMLSGFAWFAPAMSALAAFNAILGYFQNRNVVSKNVAIKPEEIE